MARGEPHRIIDLFAGPGGLAEGFAAVRDESGQKSFEIALSIEKDAVAHRTLRFRAFLRQFGDDLPQQYYDFLNGGGEEPAWHDAYPKQWEAACSEALHLELGKAETNEVLDPILDRIAAVEGSRTIVIGGPPCQAYSMVGRARNKAKADYVPRDDERHFLYRKYIEILERVRPCAFVMENVKGILSSSVDGEAIFERVLADLKAVGGGDGGYELLALEKSEHGTTRLVPSLKPRDFLIHSERFGVPQARHRVIIIGVRKNLSASAHLASAFSAAVDQAPVMSSATLRHVIETMPRLRSALSKGDNVSDWKAAIGRCVQMLLNAARSSNVPEMIALLPRLEDLATQVRDGKLPSERSSRAILPLPETCPEELRNWIQDPKVTGGDCHASRGHMEADLARYLFAAVFAEKHGRSPVARDFPGVLAPQHKNWDSGNFADRFRAQRWDHPSTTVTSHIAKDGHYFIHPDPLQCRALTVCEAARLQTFPDNYRFFGNRTEQFVQVGNAVPPFLARQIGTALMRLLVAAGADDELTEASVARDPGGSGQDQHDRKPLLSIKPEETTDDAVAAADNVRPFVGRTTSTSRRRAMRRIGRRALRR